VLLIVSSPKLFCLHGGYWLFACGVGISFPSFVLPARRLFVWMPAVLAFPWFGLPASRFFVCVLAVLALPWFVLPAPRFFVCVPAVLAFP
jgi:hypothetical protein